MKFKTRIICFLMSFIFVFVFVSPCISVFASGGSDSWQPNDEDKNGIIDEHDILIYCAKNGYILNEQQFIEASNNLDWVKSAQASSMITEMPTNLLALSLYLIEGNNLDDMSQSALESVIIEFSDTVSSRSNKSISEINSMSESEIVSLVSDVVVGVLKDSESPFDNIMDSLLGYVVVPTFKPMNIPDGYFTTTVNKSSLFSHIATIGDNVGYIRNLRGYDIYYNLSNGLFNTSFVVDINSPQIDINDWGACVSRFKNQVLFMRTGPGEDNGTYRPFYIDCYTSGTSPVVSPFLMYQQTIHRIDEENGSYSTAYSDINSFFFEFGGGINADGTHCFTGFITTENNAGIPIFKSTVEMQKFLNGLCLGYNCPTLLDVDWSGFPLADIDFSQLSNDIIAAIIENKGVSASELEQIIEETILSHIENIDENTAEMVRLLRSGLFNDNDIPYLKLILEKLNNLDFTIDSGDVNLQIDLTNVLEKLSDIESGLETETSNTSTIKTTVSNILQAQLSCNSTLSNIYAYLDELDLMLDLIESRLVAIDNKLSSTNSKLDTIIVLLGAKNLFPPTDEPSDIADKIMELIETLLPVTQQEIVKTKFPFSLPFTLGFLLNMFDADAVKPTFHFDFTILDNDVSFDFEFPDFLDGFVDVFQIFCKIGFCFFMIRLSKDIFELYNDTID